jgi:hypothetical protein
VAGPLCFTVRNQVKVIIRKLELKNRVQVAYLSGQQANIDEMRCNRAATLGMLFHWLA